MTIIDDRPSSDTNAEQVSAPGSRLDEYRDFLVEQGIAASTLKARMWVYRARWADWRTWDVSQDVVQAWLSQYEAGTQHTYVKYLKAIYGWLVATGAVAVDPMAYARSPAPPELRPGSGLEQYREFMVGRGLSPNTVDQRVTFARARWADWGTWDLPGSQIAAWLAGRDPWTKSTYFAHFVSLYDWLERTGGGDLDANPMRDMRRPATPAGRPKPLTEPELEKALATAPADVRAWLMLGYLAGLRAHEIAKFRGEDITETTLYVLGKGGRACTLPTHPLLWELAQSYPREGFWFPSPFVGREQTPIVANTVTRRISSHFHSLGLAGSTHRARHTYGTQLLRGGANLRVVQELMRHASLATTARYLGVDEEEKITALGRLGFGAGT